MPRSALYAVATLLLSAVTILSSHAALTDHPGLIFEIEASNSAGGTMQLFYDVGQPSSAHDSGRITLEPGTVLRRVRFPLPAEPIKLLRLDPADGPCTVRIGKMRLLTPQGRVLKEFGPEKLRPMWQVQPIVIVDGVATIRSNVDAIDPMLLIAEPVQASVHAWLGRSTVGVFEVLAVGGCAAFAVLLVIFGAVRSTAKVDLNDERIFNPRVPVIVFFGVFLLVTGARLAWLKNYSSPIPFWDEWETDALYLLAPLRGHFLDWQALFIPQAEHRIVLTRLITLVGTIFNGEWDPRLGMVVSAAMMGTSLGIVAAIASRAGWPFGWIAVAASTAMATLPFDTANIYWGGQSQMYALVLLAVCTLAFCCSSKIGRLTFILAPIAGLLSLGTMGTGFMAPLIGASVLILKWFREGRRARLLPVASVLTAISVLGLCLSVQSRRHAPAYAHSLDTFAAAFKAFGSWPFPPNWCWFFVIWIPWIAQCLTIFRRKQSSVLDTFGIALGAWALATVVGLSYGRPDLAPPMDSRYFTALFANVLSLLVNASALSTKVHFARKGWLIPIAASVASIYAMSSIEVRGVHAATGQIFWRNTRESLLVAFLRTGDRSGMQDLPFNGECPYWNSAVLAYYLESPLLQPILPAKLRQAVAQKIGGSLLSEPPKPGNVTLLARTCMKLGLIFAAAGCAILGMAAKLSVQERRKENSSLRTVEV